MLEISIVSDEIQNNDFSEDVKKAIAGDTSAFSRLYALVYKDLYKIALYSLRNSHDASDVVSETVVDAFQSIKNLKNEKAFRSWIMKILSCKIKQKQKEYINHKNIEYEEYCCESKDFDYEYYDLKNAIDELDEESRMILSMSIVNRYTSKEIAGICRLNASTVRSKLHRIKEKLRLSLEYDL